MKGNIQRYISYSIPFSIVRPYPIDPYSRGFTHPTPPHPFIHKQIELHEQQVLHIDDKMQWLFPISKFTRIFLKSPVRLKFFHAITIPVHVVVFSSFH